MAGCRAQETFETVSDEYIQPVAAVIQQVALRLPDGAVVSVMENQETGNLYFCDNYIITLQILEGGDLEKTLHSVTGHTKDQLKLVQTKSGEADRYDCVWAAAGEGEDQICRAAVLDDGSYHYVLSCMADASNAQSLQEQWQALFTSFCLTVPGVDPYTGS